MPKKIFRHKQINSSNQRGIAKMGRLASGAGKTMRGTQNSKEVNHYNRHRG